jgi:hypothetical protein
MFKVSEGIDFISHVHLLVIKHNRYKEELSPTKGLLRRLFAKWNIQNYSPSRLPLRYDSLLDDFEVWRCLIALAQLVGPDLFSMINL